MTKLRVCLSLAALALTGCGLISSDVTNFDLTLPDKKFSVDTASWNVDQTAAKAFLMTSCSANPTICSSAATQACAMNCSGACDMTSQTCDLSLKVAAHQAVDLQTEKPELNTIKNQPLINVTIDSVQYEVTTNTLNVDTPEIKIYVAPMSVMDWNDPSAKQVGSIAPIPAMATTGGLQDIMFADETGDAAKGKQNLIDAMSSFKTPFNVIVGSTILLDHNSMVPTGKLDAVVHIKAHASL